MYAMYAQQIREAFSKTGPEPGTRMRLESRTKRPRETDDEWNADRDHGRVSALAILKDVTLGERYLPPRLLLTTDGAEERCFANVQAEDLQHLPVRVVTIDGKESRCGALCRLLSAATPPIPDAIRTG